MSKVKGVIAAGNLQTAEAGATMLRWGGNVVDAAVAAAFASFVAEMVLTNIGSGGIALVHMRQNSKTVAYDFFSDMPRGHYDPVTADFKRILVDFGAAQQPFYIGRASAAVPGAVAGLCTMARDHGTLPLKMLLEPAINLAQAGVILSPSLGYVAELLTDILMDTPASAALYAPSGRIIQAGERLRNPHLAQTLTDLGEQGVDYFYRGDLAEQIISDQKDNGGLITHADLARYNVQQEAAITMPYRAYTILLPPPSSIGGGLIAFSLALLQTLDLTKMTPLSSRHIRTLAEVMRLTNVARQDLKDLKINVQSINRFLSPANLAIYQEQLSEVLRSNRPIEEPTFRHGPNNTTHISVIDIEGNMVSLTTSAGEGAGFIVGETGIALNNMLGELDLHPNGFHQAQAGARLQTMMSPVIVLKGQEPVLTLGSGGSTRLRSAILQVLSNVIDFDMPLAAAVEAPRVHFEENVLQLEGGIPTEVGTQLAQLGYTVNAWPGKNMYFGGVHTTKMTGNQVTAAGDFRRGGVGLVVV